MIAALQINEGYLWLWATIMAAIAVLLFVRWKLGRRIRWLRRLELHSAEQALWAQAGFFLRRRRRGSKYTPLPASMIDTPLENWDDAA